MNVIFGKKGLLFGAAALAFVYMCAVSGELRAQGPGYMTTKSQDCAQDVGVTSDGHHGGRVDPDGGWQPKGPVTDWWGPMPQTNYTPRYGCYPGNARTIHRYPAFHGYYYRNPYNYRMYSEFPWNADMADPQPYPAQVRPQTGGLPGDPYDGQEIIMNERVVESQQPTPAVKKSVPAAMGKVPQANGR